MSFEELDLALWTPSELPEARKKSERITKRGTQAEAACRFLESFVASGDKCWKHEFPANTYGFSKRAEAIAGLIRSYAFLYDVEAAQRGVSVYVYRKEK